MPDTVNTPDFLRATTQASRLLDAASNILRKMSDRAENTRDRTELFSFALMAFRSGSRLLALGGNASFGDTYCIRDDDPLALIAQADDLLLETTTAMDPAHVLTVVLDVCTLRQRLRHHVDRH